MTSGGPAERTTTVVCFIYLTAFEFYEFGYVSTLLPTFAGSVIAALLMIIVFLIFQERFVQGISVSGLKG